VALALLILGIGSSPLFAKPIVKTLTTDEDSESVSPTPTPTVSRTWILGLGGAVDLPVQNWNPVYSIGYGTKLEMSSNIDAHWIVGLGLSYFHFQGVNFSGQVTNDDLRILPMARFFPGEGKFSPYLTGGAGLAVQFASALGGTVTNLNPDVFGGAGLEMRLASQETIFVEAHYNLILAGSALGQDTVLLGGLRSGF